ncbi:MAG TPA: hypothetical protein VMD74_00850, partial [Candidatus Methylomirabilis sp.]|nr:hypothetical protein [Candidatus Methylomirabilis sp.]
VGAVGVLAAVVLMIGGLMWITAGGSSDRIGEAKAMITASLTGLVLALTSYLILSQVNPALVNLSLDVSSITPFNAPDNVTESLNTCDWKTQSACTLSQGVINSPDSACAGKDKSGVTSPTCCCSYNPAPNQNCKWSPSKCAASESMMNDPSGQLNEKAIKTCGSTENPNYCCCPGAAGCPADPKITCQSCPTCVRLSPNFCVVSSIRNCGVVPSFAEKIYNAHNAANLAGLNWEVTEAWPPTVNHSSPGHANGNSIDLAPIPRTIDKDTVAEIYVNLTETFGNSNVVYECYNPPTPPATDCCTDYRAVGVNCNHYETGVAAGGNNHFHVNN